MILYRKAAPLRIRRVVAPEPPFWCATALAPYGAKRGAPIAIDYLTSRATANDRADVTVCENVRGELERARIDAPVLIDASEAAEVVFRRGEEALVYCDEERLESASLELAIRRRHLRHFLHADRAVGRPEIHEHHLPAQ